MFDVDSRCGCSQGCAQPGLSQDAQAACSPSQGGPGPTLTLKSGQSKYLLLLDLQSGCVVALDRTLGQCLIGAWGCGTISEDQEYCRPALGRAYWPHGVRAHLQHMPWRYGSELCMLISPLALSPCSPHFPFICLSNYFPHLAQHAFLYKRLKSIAECDGASVDKVINWISAGVT